ncbi:MAG: hypothetical protein QOF51_2638, partial [Chloroflexota bacterium]|nr:hypothetical protein [Chloroflexota bacterium]
SENETYGNDVGLNRPGHLETLIRKLTGVI